MVARGARLVLLLLISHALSFGAARWPEGRVAGWSGEQSWRVGSNYVPASAINQLEIWQEDSFDPARIELELGWAERIGMNTMRVFLHDLLWEADAEGFAKRIDTFLRISERHGIKPVLVLFDSCWDPFPKLGPQRAPRPGVHNSGWVQSPGASALSDPTEHQRLERYVRGVVGAFATDRRVLAWDVWNEPTAVNPVDYERFQPRNRDEIVRALLPKVFAWVRAEGPTQPLTSGLWGAGDWSSEDTLSAVERVQVTQSDVISFHNYGDAADFERRILWLSRYRRPIVCTEFMARTAGSTFEGALPIARAHGVGVINWGLVAGKTQTYFPWSSWQEPLEAEPAIWFHDVLREDGTPFDPRETSFIRAATKGESEPLSRAASASSQRR